MEATAKENEVNWNNIFILEEFLTYVNPYEKKDFSLLSRPVRNILKPKLFFKITMSRNNIIYKLNSTILNDKEKLDISDYIQYWNNAYSYDNYKDKWNEKLSNNSGLLVLKRLLEEDCEGMGRFIRNFAINKLFNSFYFLSPIVFDLSNLTQLSLNECAFPLLMILRIGEYLKKLRVLSLNSVNFVELIKQELSPEDAYLPFNLEELSIDRCKLYRLYSVPSTFSLIQKTTRYNCEDIDRTQMIKIPSLKKLTPNFPCHSEFIEKLLRSSPEVSELTIINCDMNQSIFDIVSARDKLTNLTIIFDDNFPYVFKDKKLKIPKFNYVRFLKLHWNYIGDSILTYHECIIKHFPKLTHLALNIWEYDFEDFQLNDFLRVNLLSNNTIEKLTLELNYSDNNESIYLEYSNFVLDFSNLPNIKCLIFDIDIIPLSNIYFDNIPDKLRVIKIKFYYKSDHIKHIAENLHIFGKWNINSKGCYTYFIR